MGISQVFIRRPIATALLMAGVLVFGMATFTLLPIAALPNVDFPTIVVSARCPVPARRPWPRPWQRRSSNSSPPFQAWRRCPPPAGSARHRSRCSSTWPATSMAQRRTCRPRSTLRAACCRRHCQLRRPIKKTNPADRAILIYRRQFRRDADPGPRPICLQRAGRVVVAREWRVAGQHRRRADRPRCTCRSIRMRWPRAVSAWRMCALRWSTRRPICQRAIWKASARNSPSTPTTSCSTRSAFRNIIAAYRNGAPVQIKDIGDVINSSQSGAHRRLVRRQADRAAAGRT